MDEKHFDFGKIINMLFPVIVAVIGWLLSQLTTLNEKVQNLESKMPILITPSGQPTDSPISAERRHLLKEEIYHDIHDLQVRVKLMEERAKR